MAYCIEYGQPSGKKYAPVRHSGYLIRMICGTLILFLLMTHFFWPEGRTALREMFLPGDPEITAEAFSSMVEGLRQGEPVSDAVTAFCQALLTHEEN